jgi:hypothetical protein
MRRGDLQERVTVGRRARDRLQREIAARARPIVHEHRLAKPLCQRLAHDARDDVGRAAGADEYEHRDGPCRIGLRVGQTRQRWKYGSACGQMQELSARKFHRDPQLREPRLQQFPLPVLQ